ncbi:MAG: DNA cytosine methyltransferase, partial [Bacteroidales bacterium]|nr:DNA cytosine methyltransferase [Bacteroidales bacterium]
WEPSTKHQDASLVYRARFGSGGHVNEDINLVKTEVIPNHDLLVGGFPCQDYSVASTLSKSGGIEGKKGVLWWQIYRILSEKGALKPDYLFFENVDRLLSSPAKQRGRDFAIILASLSDLGYTVEWRVINAADYGFPQRRRRTYILGYKNGSVISDRIENLDKWVLYDGVFAKSFRFTPKEKTETEFSIDGTIPEISEHFNSGGKESPFGNAGIMSNRQVYSIDAYPLYDGATMTLGGNLIAEEYVPEDYFISNDDLKKWEYEKGAKKINRTSKNGYEYVFSEGAMAFPDSIDAPSRTIITGEGGNAPSRFKHVIKTPSGRYRRLVPIELERLNMFPDNHTLHPDVSESKRAFLMGNALVCGVIREVGKELFRQMNGEEPVSTKPIETQRNPHPTLDFNLFDELKDDLVKNCRKKSHQIDPTKNVLIGFVKDDFAEYFQNGQVSKYYYTGKTKSFPSTIALNKLYYFMPYFKGVGVKDIYLIKIARIGNKAEIRSDSNDTDPRLIFELEYIGSLEKNKPINLNIYRTYRWTVMGSIL